MRDKSVVSLLFVGRIADNEDFMREKWHFDSADEKLLVWNFYGPIAYFLAAK